ncbi:Hypothetical protein PHPALM_9631 [Phytophthora palmivora]|uniref:Integrase catalytic domain-containing protein n=1 Tax=Phytophthora palmivora TaxID=4796 RepID=A0A2P4Y6S7_9STRA|nr:Hypothetical protein PHPALM_9631 [Phytophthora palmivora]
MITSALINWSKRFGPPRMFIADQGSRFKSEVVQELDLALACAPWINDTVERLNRDVLQVLRVPLMTMKLDTHECEYLRNSVVMESAAPPAEMVATLQHNLDEMHKEAEDIHEQRRLQNTARSSGASSRSETLIRHLICMASDFGFTVMHHSGRVRTFPPTLATRAWFPDKEEPWESLHSLYYDLTVRVELYVTEHAGPRAYPSTIRNFT